MTSERKSPTASSSGVSAPAAVTRGQDAYAAVKAAIRSTVFPPGYHATEQEIADRLGMSRTPVHEALIRLQEEGLVRVMPKRGVLIVPLSAEDMREVYEVIVALEGAAAGLLAGLPATQRHAAADALTAAHEKMKSALTAEELEHWAAADDAFHRALFDHCGNARLAKMAYTILDQSHRARLATLKLRKRPEGSSKEHHTIIAAIKSGDVAGAAEAAAAHRRRAASEIIPLIERLGMRML